MVFLISEVMPCDTIDTTDVLWTVMDTKSGVVAVEFNLMPKSCGYTSYRLDLYVDEKVTDAEVCANRTSFPSRHSRRYADILNRGPKNNKNISACGKVSFFLRLMIRCFEWTECVCKTTVLPT
jgi:hypothetical protein